MADIVPDSWLERGLGAEGGGRLQAPPRPTRDHQQLKKVLAKVGKAGQPGPARRAHSFAGPAAGDGTPDDPLRGREARAFVKDRRRSLQGARATKYLQAWPTDSLVHVIPVVEFVGIGRRFSGIEEHVAMRYPCCDAVDVGTPDTLSTFPEPGRRRWTNTSRFSAAAWESPSLRAAENHSREIGTCGDGHRHNRERGQHLRDAPNREYRDEGVQPAGRHPSCCLLYTSDAADE